MSGRRISDKTKEKRGFGTGSGINYIPWFTVGEVSSKGKKIMPFGLKTSRPHVFLSSFEGDYFYYLDNTDVIGDIREQYPLDLSVTKALCEEFGINHIRDKEGRLTRFTTDFFISKTNGEIVARSCKMSTDLNIPTEQAERLKEKLAIEDEYYKRLGIDWKVVTEECFDRIKAHNYGSCYKMRTLSRYDNRFQEYETYKRYILMLLDMLLTHPEKALRDIINDYEVAGDIIGNGFNVLRHMIINKVIYIDMHSFLVNKEPLIIERYEKDLERYIKWIWDRNSNLKSETQFVYTQ